MVKKSKSQEEKAESKETKDSKESEVNEEKQEAGGKKQEEKIKEKKPLEVNPEKPQKSSFLDWEISTKTFILSHLTLLILGLIFIFGLSFYLNKDFPKLGINDYLPVTQKPSSFSLEINNPDDELLVTDKSLIVSGTTSPNAAIIVTNIEAQENFGLEASNRGDFSKIITLTPGVNLLEIQAFDQSGNSKLETRTIYYSEEKI